MISDENYDRIVEAIYEAAIDPLRWREVVDTLTAGFGAIGSSAYSVFALKAGIDGIWSTDADPDFIEAYASRYASQDKLAEALWRRIPMPSLTYRWDEILPREKLISWEGFRDLLAPRGVEDGVGLLVDGDGHRATQLMIYTPRWSDLKIEDAKRAMERIGSHFQRAMRIHWHLESARVMADRATMTLDMFSYGVSWLSSQGTVLYKNREMERILALGDGISLSGDRLRVADSAARRTLKNSAASAARGGESAFLISRASGAEPFRARIGPLPLNAAALRLPGAAAIFLISDATHVTKGAVETACKIFKLTPAEGRVLGLLMIGLDAKAASEKLGTSTATVRTQVKSVLAKCGARRQADLVRIVARLP